MIVLDTNVLSALVRERPDPKVVAWLDAQPPTSIWTNAVTVLEIRYGLHILPSGKRRSALMQAFALLLVETLAGRIAPFDTPAAEEAAKLMARRHALGRPGDLRDTMIAGIVMASHAQLATRNASRFGDLPVPVIDPWLA